MQNWKQDFYTRYSTLFNKKIDEDMYRRYVPYGKYIIRKCFPVDTNIRILDMGCGFGGFLKVFADQGYINIEGIDVSAEDVNYAHQFGVKQVRSGDMMEELRHSYGNQYDIVLFLDVIEHFEPHEVLEIFRESYKVLKPGGALILHVPNAEGIFGSRIRYSDFTHELAFTAKSLAQLAAYAGFGTSVCFEDHPLAHTVKGFIRMLLWPIVTFPFRVLHAIETGTYAVKLSQNILFKTVKS